MCHSMVKTLYLFSLTNTKISDTNECAPAPCKNGATCVDLVGSYRCDCVTGYSGSNCETSKNLKCHYDQKYKFSVLFIF